jgi:hypothetical protein
MISCPGLPKSRRGHEPYNIYIGKMSPFVDFITFKGIGRPVEGCFRVVNFYLDDLVGNYTGKVQMDKYQG